MITCSKCGIELHKIGDKFYTLSRTGRDLLKKDKSNSKKYYRPYKEFKRLCCDNFKSKVCAIANLEDV